MYELNFVGVSIAWDPCDEGENPKCSISRACCPWWAW